MRDRGEMLFGTSAEVYGEASEPVRIISLLVKNHIKCEIFSSDLNHLEIQFLYVPIIMLPHLRARYPERSKFRKKDRAYDCAPALDYDIFINGNHQDILREYVGGILPHTQKIVSIGASANQAIIFHSIVRSSTWKLAQN
jgi:hypothetical protein